MLFLTLFTLSILAFAAPFNLLANTTAPFSISRADYNTTRLLLFVSHLESYIFTQGCSKFTSSDFESAGFDASTWENVCGIAIEKAAAVANFHAILDKSGVPPVVAECEYDVAFSGPGSWVQLAREVGIVGVGAWLGGVKAVEDNGVLQQFIASTATTEARHDTYMRLQAGAIVAPSIYDTSIPPEWAWSLIQRWIQACPDPLAYPIAPELEIDFRNPHIGKSLNVSLSWNPKEFVVEVQPDQPIYLALVYNSPGDKPILLPVHRRGHGTGTAVIPRGYIAGVIVAALTTFVELDSVEYLVEYGTLAGPVELLMS